VIYELRQQTSSAPPAKASPPPPLVIASPGSDIEARLATLERLTPGVYKKLEQLGARLEEGLLRAADRAGVKVTINRVGSMFTVFFQDGKVIDLATAKKSDASRFAKFFHGMLDEGVYLPPSQFEAAFISAAHTEDDIDITIEAAAKVLKSLES